MREIKFRYRIRNPQNDAEFFAYFTILMIEHGDPLLNPLDYRIIARDLWTGLKDKNGKEIYEGDIVRVKVRIDDEHGGYYLSDEEDIIKVHPFNYESCGITWFPKDAEVIGNIYENPELLEEK